MSCLWGLGSPTCQHQCQPAPTHLARFKPQPVRAGLVENDGKLGTHPSKMCKMHGKLLHKTNLLALGRPTNTSATSNCTLEIPGARPQFLSASCQPWLACYGQVNILQGLSQIRKRHVQSVRSIHSNSHL